MDNSKTTTAQQAATDAAAHETAARLNKAEQDRAEREKAAADANSRARDRQAEAKTAQDERDRQHAAQLKARAEADEMEAERAPEVAEKAERVKAEAEGRDGEGAHQDLRLWTIRPKDRNAPPFHFTGTVQTYVVAARSEKEARHIAASAHTGDMAGAWEDEALSVCIELAPDKPCLVARDMGA